LRPFIEYSFVAEPYARLCFWDVSGLLVQDDLATATRTPVPLKLLQRGVNVEGMLRFPIDGEGSERMGRVFFSMDGKCVAALRYDRSVNIWNMRTGERLRRFALPPEVRTDQAEELKSMAFDPTNRYLAAGLNYCMLPGNVSAVIVWDVMTGRKVLHKRQRYGVSQVAFSPNGDLICGEYSSAPNGVDTHGRVTIRKAGELDDPESVRLFHTPCSVESLAVVPGVGIATGDSHGQTMLWHVEVGGAPYEPTGKLLAVAKENGLRVISLAVGQGGKLLAAGDWDGIARVWKIVSPRPSP